MIGFLEELKGCAVAPLDSDERSELVSLRKEHEKMKKLIEASESKGPAKKAASDKSDSDSEEVHHSNYIVSRMETSFRPCLPSTWKTRRHWLANQGLQSVLRSSEDTTRKSFSSLLLFLSLMSLKKSKQK
jgi:hypothetical protein